MFWRVQQSKNTKLIIYVCKITRKRKLLHKWFAKIKTRVKYFYNIRLIWQMQICTFEGIISSALSKQWRYTRFFYIKKGVQKGHRGAANSEQCKIYGLNCSLIDSSYTKLSADLWSQWAWFFLFFGILFKQLHK